MLCYANTRWDLKGISFGQSWDLETKEAETGINTIESGYIKHLYDVAAQQRLIVIVDVEKTSNLSTFSMLESLEDASVEEVTGLRDYFLFAEDAKTHCRNV